MKKMIILSFLIIFTQCKGQKGKNNMQKKYSHTNDLIHETSPYLLQHAHNPVNWKAWNKETLELAKKENKLLLISIGYAACHWCHVMEEESFENEEVAKLMNEHFINIKIDREELPNVDQTYMTAVQLMTGRGGWPLNCVALPDGKPVWGGTYFPKEQWMEALKNIVNIYENQPEKIQEYADKLTKGVQAHNIIPVNTQKAIFTKKELEKAVAVFQKSLDKEKGGRKGSPKFPMPVNLEFLLRYGVQNKDKEVLDYVHTSLRKMAYGGIYDQINGGFSRYSTDEEWHIPHFEKMLYDNAQLVSLYSKAYQLTNDELYKNVVFETLHFVAKTLTNEEGVFYTSLDADSKNAKGELEEGAYYAFTKKELQQIIKKDFSLFESYFEINDEGAFWEDDKYVLISQNNREFAKQHHLEEKELQLKISQWKKSLSEYQNKRSKPRLDDKTLTSWNALMIRAYIDAYATFGEQSFLDVALKNARFIVEKQLQKSGELFHNYKKGKTTINGFLEDYATVIDAFIGVYETTLDEYWLRLAKDVTEYAITHFYDEKMGLFYFTSNDDTTLISRSVETHDNVIPASNSIMAHNLFELGHHFYSKKYLKMSEKMLNSMKNNALEYPSSYANWLNLWCNYAFDFYEISIVGEDALKMVAEIDKKYIPNKLMSGGTKKSDLPLLKDRFSEGNTLVYICVDGACQAPMEDVEEVFDILEK